MRLTVCPLRGAGHDSWVGELMYLKIERMLRGVTRWVALIGGKNAR